MVGKEIQFFFGIYFFLFISEFTNVVQSQNGQSIYQSIDSNIKSEGVSQVINQNPIAIQDQNQPQQSISIGNSGSPFALSQGQNQQSINTVNSGSPFVLSQDQNQQSINTVNSGSPFVLSQDQNQQSINTGNPGQPFSLSQRNTGSPISSSQDGQDIILRGQQSDPVDLTLKGANNSSGKGQLNGFFESLSRLLMPAATDFVNCFKSNLLEFCKVKIIGCFMQENPVPCVLKALCGGKPYCTGSENESTKNYQVQPQLVNYALDKFGLNCYLIKSCFNGMKTSWEGIGKRLINLVMSINPSMAQIKLPF